MLDGLGKSMEMLRFMFRICTDKEHLQRNCNKSH
jgi:hypothetical protein